MYTAVPLPLYLMILEVIWAEAVCSHMTDRVETCYNELFSNRIPSHMWKRTEQCTAIFIYYFLALNVQLHVSCLMKGINMKRYIQSCQSQLGEIQKCS